MEEADRHGERRRAWLAITLATVVMVFSYFPFAQAFARPAERGIDGGLVAVSLAIAPLVFVALAVVSRNPSPRRVLQAMGLLLGLGLTFGLVSPVLGAAAGFGAGGALVLRDPGYLGTMRVRLVAVAITVAYTLVLLLTITPAGVFAGALLPLMSLGFADEVTAWRHDRERSRPASTQE